MAPDPLRLLTTDGERLDAAHLPRRPQGPAGDIGVVLGHGFTGSWQRPPVHGDRGNEVSLEHPRALAAAAAPPCELWEVPGFRHGEAAAPSELLHRLGRHLPALVAPG